MVERQHHGHTGGPPGEGGLVPQLIAWEVTRSCLLSCRHCRASASREVCQGELTTDECFRLLDNVAAFARPIIILTGGEPMLRPDNYDIAAYAHRLGLPVVMAPCGLLVDEAAARKIVASGVRRISLSLDGARVETHDAFRGFAGSYESILRAVEACRSAGLSFQINSTISRHNLSELNELLELSIRLGAAVFNPFLLVPTGRGRELIDQELTPEQYEQALGWLAGQQARTDIQLRVTCAPHYQRVLRQCGMGELAGHGRGCMGGKGFAFVSHTGKVQICGFLDVECGDLRASAMDFRRIWETSPVFLQVRDVDRYHGRCGYCEYRKVCGGCRARAFAVSGDYLGEEPFCTHHPRAAVDANTDKRGSGCVTGPRFSGGSGATPSPFPSPAEHSQPHADDCRRGGGVRGGGTHDTPAEAGTCYTAMSESRTNLSNTPHPLVESMGDTPMPECISPVLTETQRRVLSAIQSDLPIDRRPFDVLDARLGLEPGGVLGAVRSLTQAGVIRRLGAVFDSRRLGFVSTLVAGKVPPAKLEVVAARASAIAGVTHNYRREHAYNLWFTLTCPTQRELDAALAYLRAGADGCELHSLPALAVYKSRVVFSLDESAGTDEPVTPAAPAEVVQLDDRQKSIVHVLQGSLPLVEEPFVALAGQLGLPVDDLLEQVRHWLAGGVIRRVGAIVAHRRIGLVANGMAVFAVPPDRLDEAGRRLARERAISHVYVRPTLPDWPYNLFAMVHGTSEVEVRGLVQRLAGELGLPTWDILFSTAEYKKASMEFW